MTYGNSSIPPFHSLPVPAYYRTECQDKYSTSRLAHHVAYFDNECASSLQLTPCLDLDDSTTSTSERSMPSYECKPFVHGHQYSRKVRCFGPWGDAVGFANATVSEISRTIKDNQRSNTTGSENQRTNKKV